MVKMTNIENLKAKTVEELAENILMYTNSSFRDYTFCCNNCDCYSYYAPHCTAGDDMSASCLLAIRKWLESEAEE